MARFPQLSPRELNFKQREVADLIASGPRGQLRGPFLFLLHSPDLALRVQALGEYLRFNTSMPDSLIELGVLITARQHHCANIWHSHRALAISAGLSGDIIAAVANEQTPALMSPSESAVYSFCKELNLNGSVGDDALTQVVKRWGNEGAIDLIGLCGYYILLAMVLNTAQVPLPESAVPFER